MCGSGVDEKRAVQTKNQSRTSHATSQNAWFNSSAPRGERRNVKLKIKSYETGFIWTCFQCVNSWLVWRAVDVTDWEHMNKGAEQPVGFLRGMGRETEHLSPVLTVSLRRYSLSWVISPEKRASICYFQNVIQWKISMYFTNLRN